MTTNSKRGWTAEEDQTLRSIVRPMPTQQIKWVLVAQILQKAIGRTRTGKQCRQRWQHQLSPNITHDEWTLKQQQQLFELQQRIGNRWSLIAEEMPGRTDNSVKNYFYSCLRRALTKLNLYLAARRSHTHGSIRSFEGQFISKLLAVVDGKYDKKIRVKNHQTIDLSKNILRKIVYLVQQDEQIFLEPNQPEIEQLVGQMQDFRKNCKKRKQIKADTPEKYIIGSQEQNSLHINQGCSKPSRSLKNKKRLDLDECQMINERKEQKFTFTWQKQPTNQILDGSTPCRQEVNLERSLTDQNGGTMQKSMTSQTASDHMKQENDEPQMFKLFSTEELQRNNNLWQFLAEIPSQNRYFPSDQSLWEREDDKIIRLKSLWMPTHLQQEGFSHFFGQTQLVTKSKMLEASIAFGEILLNTYNSECIEQCIIAPEQASDF